MKLKPKELHFLCLLTGLDNYNEKDLDETLKGLVEFLTSDKVNEETIKKLQRTNIGKGFLYDIMNDKSNEIAPEKGDCFGTYDEKEEECKYCSVNVDCVAYMEMSKQISNKKGGTMENTNGKNGKATAAPESDNKPEGQQPEATVEASNTSAESQEVVKTPAPKKTTKKTTTPKSKAEEKPKSKEVSKEMATKKTAKKAAPKAAKVKKETNPKVKKETKPKVKVTDLLNGIKVKDIKTCYAVSYEGCNILVQRRAATKDGADAIGVAVPKHHKEWIEELKSSAIRTKHLTNHTLLVLPAEKFVAWVKEPRAKAEKGQ